MPRGLRSAHADGGEFLRTHKAPLRVNTDVETVVPEGARCQVTAALADGPFLPAPFQGEWCLLVPTYKEPGGLQDSPSGPTQLGSDTGLHLDTKSKY